MILLLFVARKIKDLLARPAEMKAGSDSRFAELQRYRLTNILDINLFRLVLANRAALGLKKVARLVVSQPIKTTEAKRRQSVVIGK